MPGFENCAGITVTSSRLLLVQIAKKDDRFVLENLDEAYYPELLDFEIDKETKISTMIQTALNELLLKKALTSKSVSFALPFQFFYHMQVPFDANLLYHDLIEEFRKELSILYPFVSPKELVIQYFHIGKNDLVNYDTAFVLAIRRKYLDMFYNLCSYNNLTLKFIDNIHLASEKSLSVIRAYDEKSLTLSAYLNNKYLSLIYSLEGKFISYQILPLNDIREAAEHLKQISGKDNGKDNFEKHSIDGAYICGEDLTAKIVENLSEQAELNFVQFNPFDKIVPNNKLFENLNYLNKFNTFSPSAGISFRLA